MMCLQFRTCAKKVFGTLAFFLIFNFFIYPSSVRATSVPPFPPFSVEGNPPGEYYFGAIFPLFHYVRPAYLKILENRDRSRTYEALHICGNSDSDRRDYVCTNDGDTCDGGEVDICTKDGNIAYTTFSQPNNSCSVKKITDEQPAGTQGKCDYLQTPSLSSPVKGTDFSSDSQDLPFPKLQNEARAYSNIGDETNSLTYGSHQLLLNQADKVIKQLLVVKRARQTKDTVAKTGEWPLGWVDWGYITANGKTLFQINDELPGDVSGAGFAIVESVDDFFLNAGNLEAVSDASAAKENVIRLVSEAMAQQSPPQWAIDLTQAPLYPPSFRQGYVRPSICLWDLCCPGLRCPVPEELLIGVKRGLYYDISVSQAFGAALDDLFLNYPLDEGIKLFVKMVANNQLIRFAGSAAPNAIPSKIKERLEAEIQDPCFQYRPTPTWLSFTTYIDYLDNPDFLGPGQTCPGYQLAPTFNKEKGGSYPASGLGYILSLIWGQKVDDVEPVKYHLITIPDAMSQSMDEIQQVVYNTRDTLTALEAIQQYNDNLSNTVNNEADGLFAAKALNAGDPKRRFSGYFTCTDPLYSQQIETSVEAYALGTRIGCFDETTSATGKCDPKLFANILEKGGYPVPTTPLSKAQSVYAMHEVKLTPEQMEIYGKASAVTGVPCEVLAGIHYIEGLLDPKKSLVSGRLLGTPEPDAGGQVFNTLLETAVYAGDHLKGKVGGDISDVKTLITALSRYNGGGNSNCQPSYPYPIPYSGGCPPLFEGEDDLYPLSWLDEKHSSMFLLYCDDRLACPPQPYDSPGAFTFALMVYENLTKDGGL